MASAYFKAFVGKNNEFYFSLYAPNNEIILQSEGYKTAIGRNNGIESVRKNAPDGSNYRIKELDNGKWHFNLHSADNGQVIGQSQQYASEPGAEKGMHAVMEYAAGAEVRD